VHLPPTLIYPTQAVTEQQAAQAEAATLAEARAGEQRRLADLRSTMDSVAAAVADMQRKQVGRPLRVGCKAEGFLGGNARCAALCWWGGGDGSGGACGPWSQLVGGCCGCKCVRGWVAAAKGDQHSKIAGWVDVVGASVCVGG